MLKFKVEYSPKMLIEKTRLLKAARFLSAFVLLLGISCYVFKVAEAQAHDGQEHSVEIIMHDSYYEPKDIDITTGTKVIFINAGEDKHWPASDIHPTHEILSEFDSLEGIDPGTEYSYTFNEPGLWRYHDHLVPDIVGKITVTGESKVKQNRKSWCLCVLSRITDQFRSEENGSLAAISESENLNNNTESIPSYIKQYGINSAIENVRLNSENDSDCHNIAHEIGREAYNITGSEVFKAHVPQCLSGAIHGATEGFFAKNGTNNLKEDVNVVCANEVNSFFSHQCLHGIGHGLMAWTAYDIHEALELCDLLEEGLYSCYSGVFMENVVGGLTGLTGHKTNYLSDDLHMPCNVVDQQYVYACYGYQSTRMTQLIGNDFATIASECLSIEEHRSACFHSMGRDVHFIHSNNNESKKIEIGCSDHDGEPEMTISCIDGAAAMTMWTYEDSFNGIELCSLMQSQTNKDSCFSSITSRISDVSSSTADSTVFCNTMPNEYKEKCLDLL